MIGAHARLWERHRMGLVPEDCPLIACGRWLPLTSFAFTPVGDIGISLDE
jgi:hypothetical protein